ncbi:hypothetical protein [Kribbella catacumbae]|uniref:hypothetical protein n=1 Tax=Kribbella catacumbae TaxID=460086 RepID=UPI0003A847FD|nr:hypothetical protein [Kribbella catacumbae]
MSLSNPSPRRMTRRGTRTLKAAYAQAARDVKRMDPAVLAAVGRSGMNGSDLKHLAHANVAALYGTGHERFAQQLNAQAAAQVQATTPSNQRTRNPFKKLSQWNENRKDVRDGKYLLKMAYAQAKSEVKRIDPAVREAIGRSGVDKQDLKMLSHAQMSGVVRSGIEQAAQQHYAQARAAAAAVAARPPVVRQTMGQRAANVVNTASRWSKAVGDGSRAVADGSKAVLDGAKAKAEKFRADYSERRQNPTGRSAQPTAPAAFADGPPTIELPVITPETAPAAAQAAPDLAAVKAADAKAFHVGLNHTVVVPAFETPETGGRHSAPAGVSSDGPVFNGPVNGVQMANGATGPVTQNQYGVESSRPTAETSQPGAESISGQQFEWNNGNSPVDQQTDQSGKPAKGGPPAPGADPAMAPAAAAVATKPAAHQAADGQKSEAATGHNKHRKPDGLDR